MIERVDVAVVGGGIAGLALANRLRELDPDLRVVVLEAGNRLGGKIQTEIVETPEGRFVVEAGPDAMLAAKPWAADLARRLGLGDELLAINQIRPAVSICIGGQLRPLTGGIGQIGPTSIGGALRSPLLSPVGKFRAMGDLMVGRGEPNTDESVATFTRRRFGAEVAERIAEPLAAGIYNADPEKLSMAATMPQMRNLERTYRSILLGSRGGPARLPGPAFLTIHDGMLLVDKLREANSSSLRSRSVVRSITLAPSDSFELVLAGGSLITADRVILAIPAVSASALLAEMAPDAAALLRHFRTADSAVVSIGFSASAIRRDVPGYGIVFPAVERHPFNAITISSRKFPDRAPLGCDLVRVFVGGHRSPGSLELGDEQLMELALDSLNKWLGTTSPPLFTLVRRLVASSPQYDVGHLERMEAIEAALPVGMHVLGGVFRGIGIPDIVHDAERIADLVVTSLGVRNGGLLATQGVV